MRFLLLTILYFVVSNLSGQTNNNIKYYTDSSTFPNKTIPYDTVTTTFIDSIKSNLTSYPTEKQVKDNLVYYENPNGGWWAIYNVNKSIWIKIPLPYDL